MNFIVLFSPDLKDEVKRTISEVTARISGYKRIRNPSKFLLSVDTATTIFTLHEYGKETLNKTSIPKLLLIPPSVRHHPYSWRYSADSYGLPPRANKC